MLLFDQQAWLPFTLQHPYHSTPRQQTLADGATLTLLDTGIVEIEPADGISTSLDLIISCGVHGNETAPIELVLQLADALADGQLSSRARVLLIIGNPPAIEAGTRFVEENMNRLFSGAHYQGQTPYNAERQRAARLEAAVSAFYLRGQQLTPGQSRTRVHYDLHTAIRASKHRKFAVYPYRPEQDWQPAALARLQQAGVNTVLLSHAPTTTFSYFSWQAFAAEAFTVELGKVKPFGQNDMAEFEACYQTLAQWVTQGALTTPSIDHNTLNLYSVCRAINRTQSAFSLPFADDLPNFSSFSKGAPLATDGTNTIVAEHEGEAVVFPNAQVAVGQRAMLTVVPVHLNDVTG